MTKKEVINMINELSDDDNIDVAFFNVEYGGYEKVNFIEKRKVHEIKKDAGLCEGESDFADGHKYKEYKEDYEEEEKEIILISKHVIY